MRTMKQKKLCSAAALFLLVITIFSLSASAQQVTYYNFDTPQSTPSQTEYQCPSSGPTSGALICFNNNNLTQSTPSYFSDTYPTNINPGGTNPNYAVLMTPASLHQASSLWFSIPQQVTSGFTSYFAFRFTPDPTAYATADGIAFVVQNAQTSGYDSGTGCAANGVGPNIVGGDGGCIGYGGIPNSLAFELDTYQNLWDPADNPNSLNDNHVAIQNCGPGIANSPSHQGSCLVQLGSTISPNTLLPAISSSPGITLADGNIHQVVIIYSGPSEATPNLLQIFIDPQFNQGTHTPVAGSVPVLSGTYNLTNGLTLPNGTAYVGFTSSTGAADEQHEVLAWTFTPHTAVTQQQPLNPPGQTTSFPDGSYNYAVTYPSTQTPYTGINMVVTANTVTPAFFQTLIAGGPFQGSQCQVYDETGGNCVIYSVSCNQGGESVACPSVPQGDTNPADLIAVSAAFNNSTPLVNPGYLQGDPLYSLITSITGDGATATVTCQGECSVTQGQTVSVVGSSIAGFNGSVTVLSTPVPNTFTYASTVTASSSAPATGGYLTSNNVQNIITGYTDSLIIDSGVSGKTKNFSDFVVTSPTAAPTGLSASAPADTYGQSQSVIVTATSGNGNPTGTIDLTVDTSPTLYTATLTPVNGSTTQSTASFSLPLSGGPHTLYISYPSTGVFLGNTTSVPVTVAQATPKVSITGTPQTGTAAYNSSFAVGGASSDPSATANFSVTGVCALAGNTVTITSGSGTCTVIANWASDSNFLAAMTSVNITATKAGSNTAIITDSPNPTTIQSPVMLTFSVTGNGTPTGTYSVASSVAGDPSCKGSLPAAPCTLTFATPGSRTLTISYSGDGNFAASSTSVLQAVNPTPIASLSASSLNFGTFYVGGIGEQSVTLTNVGDATMTITNPILFDVGNGDSKEFIALNLCPTSLAAGKSCTIYVLFVAGPSYNTQTAILKVMDNAPNSPQTVNLTANVINPLDTFNVSQLSFGPVKAGTPSQSTVSMTNNGATPLTISGFAFRGADPGDFTESSNCPATLNAGAACSVSITFTPAKTGARTATLVVTNNTQNGSTQLPLSGTGK